jgi:hypothetical protein
MRVFGARGRGTAGRNVPCNALVVNHPTSHSRTDIHAGARRALKCSALRDLRASRPARKVSTRSGPRRNVARRRADFACGIAGAVLVTVSAAFRCSCDPHVSSHPRATGSPRSVEHPRATAISLSSAHPRATGIFIPVERPRADPCRAACAPDVVRWAGGALEPA